MGGDVLWSVANRVPTTGDTGYGKMCSMSIQYDLHSHSTASDGTLTPAELVQRARRCGVDVLALTDHDTTAGLEEAACAARGEGLMLIPGVEISVTWQARTVHVVGLNVDRRHGALQQGLAHLRRFRHWRAGEIARRLAQAGVAGALEGARARAAGSIVSRTHFAHYLVEVGRAADVREVFRKYLVRNKPGHVPGQWAELDEAVGWIRAAGGQAVIAHPARYRLTASKLRRLLGEFRECGGEGLEVVSGSHSHDDSHAMARHARSVGLMASCGSDYHGPENPWTELGHLPPLPRACEPIWETARWPAGGPGERRAVGCD